ncbi:glycosyltransferase family 2 protein [uncultured Deefgea sp.]|uniref:glycosyltransferase family 2 protein n=1 Tax=uncultured Deefgea sp. TaxID=1304914 RepID=UPI00259A50E4|nr:glycosyltransferase family 2 protein [uncultured Deefgea sp.]
MSEITHSLVIPVYRNSASIPRLVQVLNELALQLNRAFEVVFVVDGSPDDSYFQLKKELVNISFSAQVLQHSRNFGSFAAIRSGMEAARGQFISVMAADMQEPAELTLEFYKALEDGVCDVVVGTRNSREDPFLSKMASSIFWGLYRRLVVKEMPEGGVDIFGCNRVFRDQLLLLNESRSSLIALIFWLGFRRKVVSYDRVARQEGVSGWTLSKKIDYMMDSIFAFTDYPVRALTSAGVAATLLSLFLSILVIAAKISGLVTVPGYAATMLTILFFGGINIFGLGLVGTYAWRAYENTKQRPVSIVMKSEKF